MGTRSAPDGVRIFLLGGFRVRVGPHPIDDAAWRLRRARSVVKLLALAPGHRLHREQVITALWPDQAPEPALNNLHQAMHTARRALSLALAAGEETGQVSSETRHERPGLLYIHDHIVRLEPPLPLWVDVEAFEAAAARASGTADIGAYETAIGLYAGELLPDDRYEEWTVERREALARRYLALLSDLAALLERGGEFPRAAENLRRVLAADPAHEEAHTGLMRLFALMGQRQEALRQFHDLQTALKEIDADPQPASVELHKAILAGDLAKLTRSASRPVAGPARVQPRRVAATPRERPGNLPAPLTTFVGRERELVLLKNLLADTRLLTLTGPGGSGKTRLGLELAAAVRDRFSHGVWWVDLQALTDFTQVVQAVAATLGVREQPGRSLDAALAEWLGERSTLLVLDNCEHLLTGCAVLADRLLQVCPSLRVLTTSREHLGVPGESRWPVTPLSVPPKDGRLSPEELRTFEAVRLFETRSRAVHPAFTLNESNAANIAEICRRLDGLPLAIELAAARTHVLSAAQILDRLADRLARLPIPGRATPRYSTLAGAIDWSYRLLGERERALFRRLAVFAGGFTLEAAQAVCADAPVDAGRTLDLLASLVDKSLVMVDERPDGSMRYRLLETIREYAHEKLASTTEEIPEAAWEMSATRHRHAAWCLSLAVHAEPELDGPDQKKAVARFEVEYGNLRAALEWSLSPDLASMALRMTASLCAFWLRAGFFQEARAWLKRALPMTDSVPLSLRATLLRRAARFAEIQGDFAEARALGQQSLLAARASGDARVLSDCLFDVGIRAENEADFAQAEALWLESLAIRRALGDRAGVVEALYGLGDLTQYQEHYEAARRFYEESLAVAREINNMDGMWWNCRGLGNLARQQQDFEEAERFYAESLAAARERASPRAVAWVTVELASLALDRGEYAIAASRLQEALAVFREFGEVCPIVYALERLAVLAVMCDDPRRAATLLAAVETIREEVGLRLRLSPRATYDACTAALRSSLDAGTLTAAYDRGRAMTFQDALHYALATASSGEHRASQHTWDAGLADSYGAPPS